MGRFEAKYTLVAARAMDLAELFNACHAGLPGVAPGRIEINEPVGPSTDGGKQALQHIRLIPGDGSPALIVGSVNQALMSVDIRTYRLLSQLHAQRFKGALLPVDAEQYQGILARLQLFFSGQGYQAVMIDVTPSMMPPSMARSSAASVSASSGSGAASVALWLVAVVALVAAIGAVAFFVLR